MTLTSGQLPNRPARFVCRRIITGRDAPGRDQQTRHRPHQNTWKRSWPGDGQRQHQPRLPANHLDGVREIFRLAEQSGLTVGFRGGGSSYGDAALNSENILIDFRRMNRILDWDPAGAYPPGAGRHPGEVVAVRHRGWLVATVATGTMRITIGGSAAMNVHGKMPGNSAPLATTSANSTCCCPPASC